MKTIIILSLFLFGCYAGHNQNAITIKSMTEDERIEYEREYERRQAEREREYKSDRRYHPDCDDMLDFMSKCLDSLKDHQDDSDCRYNSKIAKIQNEMSDEEEDYCYKSSPNRFKLGSASDRLGYREIERWNREYLENNR